MIYTQYFPPEIGAAQTRLASMAQELQRAGHEVEVITALPNYPLEEIFPEYRGHWKVSDEWNGIPVHRYWVYSAQGSGLRRLFNYLSFIITTFWAFYSVKRPDVIFVNSGPLFLSIPAFFASRRLGVHYIFNVSDLWPRSVEKLGVLKNRWLIKWAEWLEMKSYSNATAITAVTEGIREFLIEEKNVPPEKILFLPNGIDTQIFTGLAKSNPLEQYNFGNKKVFVYPGTHGHAHALDKVLDTAKILESHEEIHFLFVGGGSEKPALLKKAKDENITNVTFVDPVNQETLHEIICNCYCGLIHQKNTPLANETRPAKMFPILGSGKGILFSGFGEGAEFIKDIQAGQVVAPENPQLLAQTILEIASKPEMVQEWGRAGREYVLKQMSWQVLVDRWLGELMPLNQMEEKPLVSIVMPAYNAQKYIRPAIDSVLAQSYGNWELLIADDMSTDRTPEIIQEYVQRDSRIRCLSSESRLGPAGARNLCFEQAKGDFIAFLDSDDMWLMHKLERQLNFMLRTKCPLSYTSFRRISQSGGRVGRILPIPNEVNYHSLLKHNVIGTLTVMVNRRVTGDLQMQRVGYEDFVLWLELVRKYGMALGYQEDCARYRVVSGSMSANKLRAAFRVWFNYRRIQKLSLSESLWFFFNYAIRVSYKHSRF